jgi:hypothetical protein
LSLCTAPVLDAAGSLLNTWCTTAAEHGADMSGGYPAGEPNGWPSSPWRWPPAQLASPCPHTPQDATVLLDALVTRPAQRGVRTSRNVLYVPLPRSNTTPAWGVFEKCRLAIIIDIERGWELVIDQATTSPVVDLIGRCDTSGIDAMLDLALLVNAGAYGNIFSR